MLLQCNPSLNPGPWFPGSLLKVPVPRGVFSGHCTRGAACAVYWELQEQVPYAGAFGGTGAFSEDH